MLSPPTSCTFSTRAFLFLFILTIGTQENHRSDADTATAYYLHKADPVFFFSLPVHIFWGSLHTETPRLIFSESNFLLMKQLHCKDVFLLLALSSHKPCDLKRYRSDFGGCHPTDSTRVSHLDHT